MGHYKLYKELDAKEEQELKDNAKSDLCFMLAIRLRRCLIDSKITQNELSDKISEITGIKTNYASSISQYLKARTNPNIEIVLNIAKVFNVSVDYLLGNTGAKSPDEYIRSFHFHTGLKDDDIKNFKRIVTLSGEELKKNSNTISSYHILNGLLDTPNLVLFLDLHRYINYKVDPNKEYTEEGNGSLTYVSKRPYLVENENPTPKAYPDNLLEELLLKNVIRDIEELKKALVEENDKKIADEEKLKNKKPTYKSLLKKDGEKNGNSEEEE